MMNSKATHKRWGKIFLLFSCTIFLCVGAIQINAIYNMDIKANNVVDDSPLGDTIMDIENNYYGRVYYGLSDRGYVYAWGNQSTYGQLGDGNTTGRMDPETAHLVKVKNGETTEYLKNIVKIKQGGYIERYKPIQITIYPAAFGVAMDRDGYVYGWGDNITNALGVTEEYLPEAVKLVDFKIKDYAVMVNTVYLLDTEGNVYVSGYYPIGLSSNGINIDPVKTFTKIETDYKGSALPKIEQIMTYTENGVLLLSEEHKVFGSGQKGKSAILGPNETDSTLYKFKEAYYSVDPPELGIKNLVNAGVGGYFFIRGNDNHLYVNINFDSNGKNKSTLQPYENVNYKGSLKFNDPEKILLNASFIDIGFNLTAVNNKIPYTSGGNPNAASTGNTNPLILSPYIEGDIKDGYQNAKKLKESEKETILLSNSGSVFINGIKQEIGKVTVSATKSDQTEYTSNTKYNDTVTLTLDHDTMVPEKVIVKETDLTTMTERTYPLTQTDTAVEPGTDRVYKEYDFYLENQAQSHVRYTVDLFKQLPTTSDVINDTTYKTGKQITFSDNILPGNTVSATISKNGGAAVSFVSGTTLNEEANYVLTLTDSYGNENTYTFKISDAVSAESLLFTKSSAGDLVYDNLITKAGNIIGTISLQYPDGMKPSTIKAMKIEAGEDGERFEVYGKDGLKVINQNLAVGTYKVKLSGTDENDLPFVGTVEINVQKASLNLELLLQKSDGQYHSDVTIQVADSLPPIQIREKDNGSFSISSLGTPTYVYERDGKHHESPNKEVGIYEVSATFPAGLSDNYEITWTKAKLHVNGIVIDETNLSEFVTFETKGGNYLPGTWTNDSILITPIHDVFEYMTVNDAETQSKQPYTYNIEGNKAVTLSFYTQDGIKASTIVNLKIDTKDPVITKFQYEEESSVRSILRTITFDQFFGKSQMLSFIGNDPTVSGSSADASGIKAYRYEYVTLNEDMSEKPDSLTKGELSPDEHIQLLVNHSYRISAWAIDEAGNEGEEQIERVFISDEVAQLLIKATSGGKPYDGSSWTNQSIEVELTGTSKAGVKTYQYSLDGVTFTNMSGNTITLPDPIKDMNNTLVYFKAINNDGSESDTTLHYKIDTVKPIVSVSGTVNGKPYDGKETDQNITIGVAVDNEVLSGTTLYYTTSIESKDSDPRSDANWKSYSTPIEHSASGTFTYYFKAISGTNIPSELISYDVIVNKKQFTDVKVKATTEGKVYHQGTWAKHDITFQVSGGLKETNQIEGYEYVVTNGAKPNASANWSKLDGNTLIINENVKNKAYWFRVLPLDPNGTISEKTLVQLDVDVPSIPIMSVEELNQSKIAQIINQLSFGSWMNEEAKVTITSTDPTSGIDYYEIEETGQRKILKKNKQGILTYGDETEVTLRARACDLAGNCTEFSSSEALKIDKVPPQILGVQDQSVYKQYYLPRFVRAEDYGSGVSRILYSKDQGEAEVIPQGHKVQGEGVYEIQAVDLAGNKTSIIFKIVRLPEIETEIDGSDQSKDIIDQIKKELEENRDQYDATEIDEYEKWIEDAEKKWEACRKKVIENDDKTAKVEGLDQTNFDPETKLFVESLNEQKVPILPRRAISIFDVYMKKGDTLIQPDGRIKVYLPYSESEPPIVYQINDDGTVKEIPCIKEGEYVSFVTDVLMKYAISNLSQEPNNTADPDPNPDIKDPDKDVPNPDSDKKKECSLEEKKELNIDTDGDGIPDINLDINGDCKPEINIDVNEDGIPDIDIDTTGNGKADINIDTNKDGKPDLNIVLHLKWKPNVTYTVNRFTYNTMKGLIPDLNVDDDGDGSADRNIDTDGDDLPDVNVDDDWFSKRGIKDPNKSTVQGTYTNGTSDTGGASTSDQTKWLVWIIMLSLTTITMIYTLVKKRYQKDTF